MTEHRGDASTLLQQLTEARARYAESLQRLSEATEFAGRFVREADAFRELVPDRHERGLIVRRAIRDRAYWDAESSAAEIRLARLGRMVVACRMGGAPQEYPQT